MAAEFFRDRHGDVETLISGQPSRLMASAPVDLCLRRTRATPLPYTDNPRPESKRRLRRTPTSLGPFGSPALRVLPSCTLHHELRDTATALQMSLRDPGAKSVRVSWAHPSGPAGQGESAGTCPRTHDTPRNFRADRDGYSKYRGRVSPRCHRSTLITDTTT